MQKLNSGHYHYDMDNGLAIKVTVTIKDKHARIDFNGTSPQNHSNFNAPQAITKACILYVLRTLVDHPIPLNEECLKPTTINIPPSSLINPDYPHAVVAGNVETSQAIVNCLYAALGCVASSQGTMNNLSFGNANYQYYETLGAGPSFNMISNHRNPWWRRILKPRKIDMSL